MNRIHRLYEIGGQSPWLDHLRRDHLEDGTIASLISRGVRGLTSNPAIVEAALKATSAYDAEILIAARQERSSEDVFWDVACEDVSRAADLLAEMYRSSEGSDGFVSIEVDPRLAHDSDGTIDQAERLWTRLNRPNVMIKVPATESGVVASEELIARGINVNVTLIFGLDRYDEVMGAHIRGVRRLAASQPHAVRHVASVASFFISRVDAVLDPHLPETLRGRTAIAQASMAWRRWRDRYSDHEWTRLANLSPRPQRPLWASTSTKNPTFNDTVYVDSLVAPGTVNTMPLATLLAFDDHGSTEPAIERNYPETTATWENLTRQVDVRSTVEKLEHDGVAAFASSIVSAIAALATKMSAVR